MKSREKTAGTEPCCKVGQVIQAHGLESLDGELVGRWTGTGDESASLRELQREVNRQILRSALADASVQTIEGEIENLRRVLRSSEVSENRRIEARRRLENDGVAVEGLLDDFVSHQTVYNHLRDCLDASAPEAPSEEEQLSRAKSTVFGLQNRTEVVTGQTLTQLGGSGLISPAAYDVIVDIQAICESCGRSQNLETLLETGGCPCKEGPE